MIIIIIIVLEKVQMTVQYLPFVQYGQLIGQTPQENIAHLCNNIFIYQSCLYTIIIPLFKCSHVPVSLCLILT